MFDGLDGRSARLLKMTSKLGEQLDSLADVVTFGVAPAFLVAAMSKDLGLAHQRLVIVADFHEHHRFILESDHFLARRAHPRKGVGILAIALDAV